MIERPCRAAENEPFVVRLSNNQRRNYAAGSTIEIGATGELIAIDPTGLEWQVPRERWLDITVGSGRAVTNRWYAQRHVR